MRLGPRQLSLSMKLETMHIRKTTGAYPRDAETARSALARHIRF